ncbi:MAG: FeoB-associated Cys-rich membrane protein [Bacteroidales bacterium]|nr:FeoB-associated Cys-rich membrane protein [Bacteroidales bacterium]
MSEKLQYIIVGIIIVVAVVYIFRRLFSDDSDCAGCEIKDCCKKKKDKRNKNISQHK